MNTADIHRNKVRITEKGYMLSINAVYSLLHIIGEQFIKSDDIVLTVSDEDKKIARESYLQRL